MRRLSAQARERRPPLPPPADPAPVWRHTKGKETIILNKLPSPSYETVSTDDPKCASIPQLTADPAPPTAPQVPAVFVPRINSIIESRKHIDPATEKAQRHVDCGPDGMDLALLYVNLLSNALILEGSRSSRICIMVHRDAVAAWFDSLQTSYPQSRIIVLQNDYEGLTTFGLFDINQSQEKHLPVIYLTDDVFKADSGAFDTLILDDVERINSTKLPDAFHTICITDDHKAALESRSVESRCIDEDRIYSHSNHAGGTLRTAVAYVELIAEAEGYAQVSAKFGLDPRIKLSDIHDIIYGEQGTSLCTLFSATAAFVQHVLAMRPNSRVLVVCRSPSCSDALTVAFERHFHGSYGPRSVLLLNGTAAGTNYHALETVSPDCRLIISRNTYESYFHPMFPVLNHPHSLFFVAESSRASVPTCGRLWTPSFLSRRHLTDVLWRVCSTSTRIRIAWPSFSSPPTPTVCIKWTRLWPTTAWIQNPSQTGVLPSRDLQ
jgi:hypothetical protein